MSSSGILEDAMSRSILRFKNSTPKSDPPLDTVPVSQIWGYITGSGVIWIQGNWIKPYQNVICFVFITGKNTCFAV